MSRTEQVAEHLAQGKTTAEIRAAMGLNNAQFQQVLLRIRKGLGWQAV